MDKEFIRRYYPYCYMNDEEFEAFYSTKEDRKNWSNRESSDLSEQALIDFKKQIEQSVMTPHEKWDRRFLELAKHISTWSKDPSTKTGCVIVDDKRRVVSLGYNGFPRGIVDKTETYDNRELKYKLVCHADRNALDNAPCSVESMTMYITHPPCFECQKSIIQKGIKRVVWYNPSAEFKSRWDKGYELLEQTTIKYIQYETE